jgi:dTDP-glucose pyrophosphorylase
MVDYQSIITAAGDSRPLFVAAGFGTPKSLVIREGATVLAQAIRSYAACPENAVVAINKDEADDWPIASMLDLEFPGIQISKVPGSAKGALISALMSAANLDEDEPVVIAAGDSFIRGGIQSHVRNFERMGASAATIVFRSQNPRWSYLATDNSGQVIQVAEKQVIGPLATTGVFFFRRSSDFLQAAQWCLVNSAHRNGTYYVSAALNHLLAAGHKISFAEISRHEYVPCALPVDFVEVSNG